MFDSLPFFQDDEDEALIFLEDGYLRTDGGDGVIDVIVANEKTRLAALLANGDAKNPATYAKDDRIPLVRNVEILLSYRLDFYSCPWTYILQLLNHDQLLSTHAGHQ